MIRIVVPLIVNCGLVAVIIVLVIFARPGDDEQSEFIHNLLTQCHVKSQCKRETSTKIFCKVCKIK